MSDLPPPPPPPPPPTEASPGATAPGQLVPVGPWPRFGARLIDGLVLFVPNAVLAAALTDDTTTSFSGVGSENFVYLLVTTMLGYAYAVWLESSRGQTVGKMALGFKVVGPDGRVPAPDVALRRNGWLLLSLVPIIGGVLSFVAAVAIGVTIANDPFKRGTHDNFAGGSAVVRSR
ncbi:MAG: RDD family protein [Acidimicrobiia bacterium]